MNGVKGHWSGNKMMETSQLSFLSTTLKGKISYICKSELLNGTLLILNNSQDLFAIASFLKNSTFLKCDQLLDVFATDYPSETRGRFQLTYSFLSTVKKNRIFVRLLVSEESNIDSLVSLYPSANWLERETWDMFGIFFKNHPDLRRILTDYGFEGFPLRKDFPLSGFTEVRYDDEKKRVVLEPIQITQEYRYFDFLSPWETK